MNGNGRSGGWQGKEGEGRGHDGRASICQRDDIIGFASTLVYFACMCPSLPSPPHSLLPSLHVYPCDLKAPLSPFLSLSFSSPETITERNNRSQDFFSYDGRTHAGVKAVAFKRRVVGEGRGYAFAISIPPLTHGHALETRGATYSISWPCLPRGQCLRSRIIFHFSYRDKAHTDREGHSGAPCRGIVSSRGRMKGEGRLYSTYLSL